VIVQTDGRDFYLIAFLLATKFDDLLRQAPPLNAIVNRTDHRFLLHSFMSISELP
jgi:hypothetical protein